MASLGHSVYLGWLKLPPFCAGVFAIGGMGTYHGIIYLEDQITDQIYGFSGYWDKAVSIVNIDFFQIAVNSTVYRQVHRATTKTIRQYMYQSFALLAICEKNDSTGDWCIPFTQGQWCRNRFRAMPCDVTLAQINQCMCTCARVNPKNSTSVDTF